MRVVHDRADARLLPSRFRFATFRVIAYLRLRRMPPRPEPGLILSIDRDQSAVEQYTASAIIAIVTSCYAAAALMRVMPAIVAVILAAPAGAFVIQFPMYALGTGLTLISRFTGAPGENHLTFQGWLLAGMLTLPALGFATSASWLRFPSVAFLAVIALNAVFAAIAFFMRGAFADIESRFEVTA